MSRVPYMKNIQKRKQRNKNQSMFLHKSKWDEKFTKLKWTIGKLGILLLITLTLTCTRRKLIMKRLHMKRFKNKKKVKNLRQNLKSQHFSKKIKSLKQQTKNWIKWKKKVTLSLGDLKNLKPIKRCRKNLKLISAIKISNHMRK